MGIFNDLWGSITAGEFYHDILLRPAKKGWALYVFLIAICALALTLYWGIQINSVADDAEAFFAGIDRSVKFENGEIINMPASHKEYEFKGYYIHVDRKYVDEQIVMNDLLQLESAALFIGPKAAFIIRQGTIQAIDYPSDFTQTIDLDYVRRVKSMLVVGAFIGGFIIWLVVKFIESMLYILIIIAPILLFKFRRMGLTYGEGIRAAMYLVTFQIIISTLLLLLSIAHIWIHLVFIAFYIFFIGGFININLAHSKRQLYQSGNSA